MDYLKCNQWLCFNTASVCEVWHSTICRNNQSKFKLHLLENDGKSQQQAWFHP